MPVVLSAHDGAVHTLTLNRPERLNAVSTDLYRGILARLEAALTDAAALDLLLTREERDLLSIMKTADWAEGVASFADRRTPVFVGR